MKEETSSKLLMEMYKLATTRKLYLGLLTLIALVCSFVTIFLLRDTLSSTQTLLGAGASVVVFGVVQVFSNINDTYYDIASSLYPERFNED